MSAKRKPSVATHYTTCAGTRPGKTLNCPTLIHSLTDSFFHLTIAESVACGYPPRRLFCTHCPWLRLFPRSSCRRTRFALKWSSLVRITWASSYSRWMALESLAGPSTRRRSAWTISRLIISTSPMASTEMHWNSGWSSRWVHCVPLLVLFQMIYIWQKPNGDWRTSTFELGLHGHWNHHSELHTADFKKFLDSFPSYVDATPWPASYEAWLY